MAHVASYPMDSTVLSSQRVTQALAFPVTAYPAPALVEVFTRADELIGLRAAWDDLASNALSPNPFYESWMLTPALRHLAAHGEQILVVTVWSLSSGDRLLIGLLPVVRRASYRGLPLPHLASWQHMHCFLSTPLVRKGWSDQFFSSLLAWYDGFRGAGSFIELRQFAGDGPFWEAAEPFLVSSRRSIEETDFHQRAALASSLSSDAYIRQALSGKRRKELTRQSNRLQEQGTVQMMTCGPHDDVDSWIHSFVALERSGWKGREASALGSNEGQHQFFRAIVREAHQRGVLFMSQLLLNHRPLAMQCTFRSGAHGFAFKIAFDEEFSRYSPGMHLELNKIAHALDGGAGFALYDSCAVPDHFMINRLWTERRAIRRLNISRRTLGSRCAVRGIAAARALYNGCKKFRLNDRRTHGTSEVES